MVEPSKAGRSPERPRFDPATGSVVLAVLRHGPIARADLARRLGLSSSSLGRLAKGLIKTGLVRERPTAQRTTTGRPTLPLEIVGSAAHFIGIKITAGAVYGVVIDLDGTVITRRKITTRARIPGTYLNRVVELIDELRSGHRRIRGVGVGVGGPVLDGSTVEEVSLLGWGEVDLGAIISGAVDLPVTVHHDVKALTLARHWFGAGRACRSLAVITIGAEIGCGLVVNDGLVEGGSGEVEHWQLVADGPRCDRGHRGCPSVLMTSGALARLASEAAGTSLDFTECLRLAREDDPTVRLVLETSAYQLGLLCARIADLVAPERIVLCGDGIDFAIIAADSVRAGLADHRSVLAEPDELIMERLDYFDLARGAATLAIRRYLLG